MILICLILELRAVIIFPSAVKKLVVKPKHNESKTSSILLISVAIFVAIILLMYVGILWT